MSITLVPNLSYKKNKRIKSPAERRSEKYLQNLPEGTQGYTYRRTEMYIRYNDAGWPGSQSAWKEVERYNVIERVEQHIFESKERAFDDALIKANEDFKKNDHMTLSSDFFHGIITLERFEKKLETSRPDIERSGNLVYWVILYEILEIKTINN
jgi:hypothetical protein